MTKTILTIDDSASIRQVVSLTLSSAGMNVLEAANGAEGYTVATTNAVDAVITDDPSTVERMLRPWMS